MRCSGLETGFRKYGQKLYKYLDKGNVDRRMILLTLQLHASGTPHLRHPRQNSLHSLHPCTISPAAFLSITSPTLSKNIT